MRKDYKDISNQKFGKLTALNCYSISRYGKNVTVWNCNCDCGKQTAVPGTMLRNGNTRSCGCYKREIAKSKASLPEGVASFNRLYDKYKRGAINRNYNFELTKEEFRNIILSNCHYCGVKPLQTIYGKNNGKFLYNGIDRVDNAIGYVNTNVVACCTMCNRMKGILDYFEFLNKINQIYVQRNASSLNVILWISDL